MGIANIINNSTTTSGGEIIRELVNASDGAGLHFDGAAGNVSGTSNLALGSKYSAEFVLSYAGSANNRLFDINGDTRFIVEFNRTGFTGKIAGYDSDFYEICDIPDDGVFHLVVTVDGTAVSAYVNGNLAGTATKNNSTSIDTVTQWTIGANDGGSFGHFEGTIYRARFYNRTLSADDVRTAYERADVPYLEQYGSQTNRLANGDFGNSGSGWSQDGGWTFNTGQGVASGTNSFSLFQPTTILETVGAYTYKYSFDYNRTSGSSTLTFRYYTGSAWVTIVDKTDASGTASGEFTVTGGATNGGIYFYANGTWTGTVDNVVLQRVGCVSDYDLAFASPTQSLTVQDRSGAADGTCSASGVTQVQPVVQGNLTSLAVSSGTARTPADGAITADDVLVNTDSHFTTGGTPKVSINTTANALTFGFSDEIAYIRKQSGAVFQWQTSDSGSNAGEIQLQPYGGSVAIGANNALTIASDGNIEQHTDSNGIVKFGVKNESTGTAARAMVNVLSDSGNLDLSMNGSNYTGVTGWADSGTISTGSGASGGLKLNAVAGGLALQTNQTTRLSIANSTGLATFDGDTKLGNGLVSNYVKHVAGLDDTVAISFTFPSQGTRWINHLIELRVAMGDDSTTTAFPTFLRYAIASLTSINGITQMDASLGSGITVGTSSSGTTFTVTLTEGSAISMDSVTVFATVTSGHGDAKCTGMTVA